VKDLLEEFQLITKAVEGQALSASTENALDADEIEALRLMLLVDWAAIELALKDDAAIAPSIKVIAKLNFIPAPFFRLK
jgi:hypothetical protein